MASFRGQNGAIAFEHRGARANPRVLLVHGLGSQLVEWPDSLLEALVAAGLCAVTFDNRDAGLSFGVDEPAPSPEALLAGREDAHLAPPYTLADMAQDAVDLLDHLGQAGAHVVGLGMGGMIGQRMAIHHPARVYSLACLMSSPGDPSLPRGDQEAERKLLATLADEPADAAAHRGADRWRASAGPRFDSEAVGLARFARRAARRAWRPQGAARQFAAMCADGDRSAALAGVAVPTLVLHGKADPLLPVEAGRATAAAIPTATLRELDDLGHDLPEPLVGDIAAAIADHVRAVRVSR